MDRDRCAQAARIFSRVNDYVLAALLKYLPLYSHTSMGVKPNLKLRSEVTTHAVIAYCLRNSDINTNTAKDFDALQILVAKVIDYQYVDDYVRWHVLEFLWMKKRFPE